MGRDTLPRFRGPCARPLSRAIVCGLLAGCLAGGPWVAEPGVAQPLPKRPSFTHLDLPTDFLPDTDLAMAQDPEGFLWFGTQRGLFRYDGYRMRLFPRRFAPEEPRPRPVAACDGVADLHVEPDGLWIATACGVERLDFESERVERWWLDDPIARVTKITPAPGAPGGWWVGTTDGLRQLDATSSTWGAPGRDAWPEAVRAKDVRALLGEKDSLWVGTSVGLYRLPPGTSSFEAVPYVDPPVDPSYHHIEALHRDSAGTLWATTADGLHRVDSSTGEYRLVLEEALPGLCVHEPRQWHYGMATDAQGALWFSSGGSLVVWRPGSDSADCFSRYGKDPRGLGGSAGSLFVDRSGTLWVATERSLDRLAPSPVGGWDYAFDTSVSDFGWQASWSLGLLGTRGKIWVGTNLGLLEIDPGSHTLLRHFMADDPELLRITGRTTVGGLPDFTILALALEDDGTLWAGTAEGLARLPPGANRFESVAVVGEASQGPRIQALAAAGGSLWVGTGQALHRYSTSEGAWTQIPLADAPTPETTSFAVRELGLGPQGRLWVATSRRGLLTVEPGALVATSPELRDADGNPVAPRRVNTFFPEAPATLWIGTEEGALDRIDLDTLEVSSPAWNRELAGRPMRSVVRVGDDLWLLTSRGLSQVDTETNQVRHWGERQGLTEPDSAFGLFQLDQSLLITGSALFELTLGSDHETQLPPVRLTDLQLSNHRQAPREVDPTSPLWGPLPSTSRLELAPHQTAVTFELAALGFARPEDLRFHYRLEGSDQPWLETQGDRPFVTYAPLAPGSYRLRVRASLEAAAPGEEPVLSGPADASLAPPGDPSTEVMLEIVVHPPWWRSRWAQALYLLAGLGALAGVLAGQRRKLRREQLLNRQLRRLDTLKDELLANTSHELRTPLFGILGLAESLRGGAEGPLAPGVQRGLQYIVASGRRLADRVDDILDLASLRRHGVELDLQPLAIAPLLHDAVELLRPLASAKQLELRLALADSLPAVLGDPKRLRQVFRHLVENALKFSEHGSVEISARSEGDDRARFEVRDQGIGMTAEELESAFNDFEQVRGDATRRQGGTGLGLALARRLVELHGGSIHAESTPGVGSRIVVLLPSTQEPPSRPVAGALPKGTSLPAASPTPPLATPAEMQTPPGSGAVDSVTTGPAPTDPVTVDPVTTGPVTTGPATTEPVTTGPGPVTPIAEILLVDDEPINHIILESYFARTAYRLTTVEGGAEALARIAEQPFDLILLDVMMPGMSGFEVCRTIRRQHPIEALPILFLSARAAIEDRIEGLACGANDYLVKPISRGELLVRVEQALTVGRRLGGAPSGPPRVEDGGVDGGGDDR